MPRAKPTNVTGLKARKKLARAVKRGDAEAPDPEIAIAKRRGVKRALAHSDSPQAMEASKKLYSSDMRAPKEYLRYTREVTSNLPLTRPVTTDKVFLDEQEFLVGSSSELKKLTLPQRPPWTYETTKEELERTEEMSYAKWIAATDALITSSASTRLEEDNRNDQETHPEFPRPLNITYFERNLEVWRQLWRVTEISSILVCLLDIRAPLLHLPQSMISYLESFCPSSPAPGGSSSTSQLRTKSVVLVLTKTDIVTPELTEAWLAYFRARFPLWGVVCVHSYNKQDSSEQGANRPKFSVGMLEVHRTALVRTLEKAHADLVGKLGESSAEGVRATVDWSAALAAPLDHVAVDEEEPGRKSLEEGREPAFLTIGLIGIFFSADTDSPTVGKSSLLNALFGKSKARAHKTPGKTKHFQTLFLTSDIRIVDCPGLRFPSGIRMEAQVLSGIPSKDEPVVEVEDKRTWRGSAPVRPKKALYLLVAYARKRGWLTAMAGREDVMRAGNAILRNLAEGAILWGFAPPGYSSVEKTLAFGIALLGTPATGLEVGSELHAHENVDEGESEEEVPLSDSDEDLSEDEEGEGMRSGRFSALVPDP
ncbi:P-loop containing nucleoside triphosphate hydrolase protein [Flagelloscypha sp. PMI_526]|nr:P-loop containing nucleoside triphosphate hydrolase protein [Flagelloscypha sp. PMI_526]